MLLSKFSVYIPINLEDCNSEGKLYGKVEQCDRIRRVLAVARKEGVEDLVINARTDALFAGDGIEDCIQRGKSYLVAGACTVFTTCASAMSIYLHLHNYRRPFLQR